LKGLQYSAEQIQAWTEKSALKHEVYLDDCADMYVAIAKNTSMTGQEITLDSGYVTK
jgi:hypothetical protein